MKVCSKCKQSKPEYEFYSKRPDCKECKKAQTSISGKLYYQKNKQRYKELHHAHYKNNKSDYIAKGAKRRATLLQATPVWVNNNELKYIYKLAQKRNLVVDHIIPLQHPDVCGLHVPANLRCISQKWNAWKSNKLLNRNHIL